MTSEGMGPADFAAITGNRNDGGLGLGNDAWLVLFILLLGWGGNRGFGGGYGGGNFGGDGYGLYPWLNNSNQLNNGFQNQLLNDNITEIRSGVTSLASQLCSCCNEMQMAMMNGFFGVEQSANARQMANMNQMFGFQNAMKDGFCDNRAGIADLKYTVAQENCLDRNQAMLNTRDIIQEIRDGNQRIIDNQTQYQMQQKDSRIADLERQLAEARLSASQIAQDQRIVDAVYNRFATCPVDTRPVYGNQPIFSCNQNQGCSCNGNNFYN